MLRRISLAFAILVLATGLSVAPRYLSSRTTTGSDFVHFESSQVHPEAITPDGTKLLVVNTPDNRLTIFDLTTQFPSPLVEIPVGLEPVSVAVRSNNEAWVVNNVSDDVSIVDLTTMHVRATLRVGDEPNDVLFAGASGNAYVSVSEEDAVKVYDPTSLTLIKTIAINGRMPRALARNAAGTLVFAEVFQAGNKTTVLSAPEVADSIPDDPDFPRDTANKHGHVNPPSVGGIVQFLSFGTDGAGYYDEYGKLWNSKIKYSQPDVDVAEINTTTNNVSRNFAGLGSINYNIAVEPGTNRVAVISTEARNPLRFEPKLSGYLVDTRISYVTPSGTVITRLLNPHINYGVTPGPQAERDSAIGIPVSIAYNAAGNRSYVASLADNKIAVLNPAAGGATSQMLARIPVVAGPTGVVVDNPRGRLYVLGRFHNQLQTLSTDSLTQVDITRVGFDPTPDEIVNGRKFFYGGFTSGHGDQSCASCHIFGDMDNLVWDLGNPLAEYVDPPTPNPLGLQGFDPQKGPMATQSLRGTLNTDPLHWRGDRANLAAFNVAFVGLMGRSNQLADSEMTAFSDFVRPLTYPPNPFQNLDRSYPDPPDAPSALQGATFFSDTAISGPFKCIDCHTLPAGTNAAMFSSAAIMEPQDLKVPQLRNLYKKTGFTDAPGAVNKRGFGYTHDGSIDNVVNFLQNPRFSFNPDTSISNVSRRNLAAFLNAFDTGMAPAVGYQVTFDGNANPQGAADVATLEARVTAGDCDLVAKGRVSGQPRGWLYLGGDQWEPDKSAESNIDTATLLALAGSGSEVTVTGVPPGSGVRMGIDRDRDTYLDGDELDAGSHPGDPLSTPNNVGVPVAAKPRFGFDRVSPNPFHGDATSQFTLGRAGRVDLVVYDVLGREVRAVARGRAMGAGRQTLVWDGRRNDGTVATGGVYFLRLITEGGTWTRMAVRLH